MPNDVKPPLSIDRPATQRPTAAPARPPAPAPQPQVSASQFVVPSGRGAAELAPRAGAPLTSTAAPDALWKTEPRWPSALREELRALPPEKRAERIRQAQARRTELEKKIGERTDELWKKLTRRHMKFRSRILRSFSANPQMPAETKARLSKALDASDRVQQRLDGIKLEAQKLPKPGTPRNQAARDRLAKSILALRREQRDLIHAAEKLMTDSGSKVDLVAQAEQQLDPTVKPERSLLSLLFGWLDECWVLQLFDAEISQRTAHQREASEQNRDVGELERELFLKREWLVQIQTKRR